MPKKFQACAEVCLCDSMPHMLKPELFMLSFWITFYICFHLIFLFFLLEICWRFSKLDNSIAVKWYQSLDDESGCSVYSLRIKFKVDLSFNESRRLYSIKFEKAYLHRRVGKMKCWKEFMKETLKTPGTFNLDSVI